MRDVTPKPFRPFWFLVFLLNLSCLAKVVRHFLWGLNREEAWANFVSECSWVMYWAELALLWTWREARSASHLEATVFCADRSTNFTDDSLFYNAKDAFPLMKIRVAALCMYSLVRMRFALSTFGLIAIFQHVFLSAESPFYRPQSPCCRNFIEVLPWDWNKCSILRWRCFHRRSAAKLGHSK